MFYSSTVANDKWNVFAVSFNADTQRISMWVDGVKEEATGCSGDLQPANNVRISKRYRN